MNVERTERTLAFRIDESLYREIKMKLAQEGLTLKSYVLGLIDQDLHSEQRKEPDYTEIVKIISQITRDVNALNEIVLNKSE